MIDSLVDVLAHSLTWMFAVGMTGCFLVIPITAFRLFSVLFERGHSDEEE